MKNIFSILLICIFTAHIHSQNFWQESYTGNFYSRSLDVSAVGNVFAFTDSFLIRSVDNGASWQIVYFTPSWSIYSAFGASPTGIIYLNSDSLRKSTDEGNNWITTTGFLSGYYPLWFLITNDEGDIFTETGVLAGSYSYRSTDEGASWIQIGVTQALLQSISFHPNGNTYAVYLGNLPPGYSDLFKSSNKGDIWENIASAPPLILIVYVAKNGHIFVGTNTTLFKSIDDGLNWELLLNASVTDITENQFGHLFASTALSGVFRSTDDGANWQQINSGLAYLTATKLTVDSLGYLYAITGISQSSQTKLYRSVESTIPVEFVSFAANVVNNEVHLNWTTATELNNKGFEILRATQNDNEWKEIGFVPGRGTTTQISSYSFTDENLNPGSYNYRLKQIDFDGTYKYYDLEQTVVISPPVGFELSQNYPNPFNPSTNIGFRIADFGFVTLKVYDVLGNEVATLVNEEKRAGVYEVEFSATGFSSGIYFYRLQTGTFIETKWMVLLK